MRSRLRFPIGVGTSSLPFFIPGDAKSGAAKAVTNDTPSRCGHSQCLPMGPTLCTTCFVKNVKTCMSMHWKSWQYWEDFCPCRKGARI